MIYVYDVLINLNEEVYDFYDWEETDDFSHIRRAPLFKVNHEVYSDFCVKKVRLQGETMSLIKDKTQLFSSRNIEVMPYGAIITDGEHAIMVEFDSKGFSKRKSKFLVNEEMEILDVSSNMKLSKLDYNVVNNKARVNNMLRSEKKTLENILDELSSLKEDSEKIDYLYYEWFERQDGVNKYDKLVSSLKKEFSYRHLEFLDLLNLLTIKK